MRLWVRRCASERSGGERRLLRILHGGFWRRGILSGCSDIIRPRFRRADGLVVRSLRAGRRVECKFGRFRNRIFLHACLLFNRRTSG